MAFMIFGLYATIEWHHLKNQPELYSLHSWLGVSLRGQGGTNALTYQFLIPDTLAQSDFTSFLSTFLTLFDYAPALLLPSCRLLR
jgi:hypothetical protein